MQIPNVLMSGINITQAAMRSVALKAMEEQKADEKNIQAELLKALKEILAEDAKKFIEQLEESGFIDEEITATESSSWIVTCQGKGTKYTEQNDSVKPAVIKNIHRLTIEQIAECLQQAIAKIQEGCERDRDLSTLASTLVATLVFRKNILTANLGDSRAILIDAFEAQRLTCEHIPVKESERIIKEGGKIIADRLEGYSAISRGIGSPWRDMKGFGHEPELSLAEIKDNSQMFVAVCTDGITGDLHDQEIATIIEALCANKNIDVSRMNKIADIIRKLAHLRGTGTNNNEKTDNKTIALIFADTKQQNLTEDGLFCVVADGCGDESASLAQYITVKLPEEFQAQINSCLERLQNTAINSKILAPDSPLLCSSNIQAELKKLDKLPEEWQLLAGDAYFYLMVEKFRKHNCDISPESPTGKELRSLLLWICTKTPVKFAFIKSKIEQLTKSSLFESKEIENSPIYEIYKAHFHGFINEQYLSKDPVESFKNLTFMREKFSTLCELKFGEKPSTKDVNVDTLLDAIIYTVNNTKSNMQQRNIGNLQK